MLVIDGTPVIDNASMNYCPFNESDVQAMILALEHSWNYRQYDSKTSRSALKSATCSKMSALRSTSNASELSGQTVTHDLEILEDFDRVLVVTDGRIAFDGRPDEAIANYRQWSHA